MSLTPRLIAIQGIGFTAIALAVQGLLDGGSGPTPPEQMRPAVIGRGPGTTVNYSDYMRALKRPAMLELQKRQAAEGRARKRRQRMQHHIAAQVLSDWF